jgi:hypothetical protein
MINTAHTVRSTEVFVPGEYTEEELVFDERRVDLEYFRHRDFKENSDYREEDLLRIVEQLLQDKKVTEEQSNKRVQRVNRPIASRKDKVNWKRQEINTYLTSGFNFTLKKIAEMCSCTRQLVKKLKTELRLMGHVKVYEYNNLHSDQAIANLQKDINDPSNIYCSVRLLKRLNPAFSKKRIRREVVKKGLKWKKMAKVPPKANERAVPNPDEIYRVLCNVTWGLFRNETEVMFVDEFKMPLNQTPRNFWSKCDGADPKFNTRWDNSTITAIVMCSIRQFEFVQLCLDEVRGPDFVYFLQQCFKRLPTDRSYLLLLDNATWHSSKYVQNSGVYRYFCFNVPGVFQLNMIENSFSAVRSDFRHRKVCDSMAEEIRVIASLFDPVTNMPRFEGYYRNYLRSLKRYLLN